MSVVSHTTPCVRQGMKRLIFPLSSPNAWTFYPPVCRLWRSSPSLWGYSQAADNFSSFLDKENELEVTGGEGGAAGATTTSADLRHHDPQPRPSAARASLRESPPGTAENAFGRGARERGVRPSSWEEGAGEGAGEEKQEDEEESCRRRVPPSAVAAEGIGDAPGAAVGRVNEFGEFDGSGGGAVQSGSIDDVSKPMPRRRKEPDPLVPGEGKRGEGGRLSLSSILHQSKGPTLLGDSGEEPFFSGVASKGEDTPGRDQPESPEGWG